MKRLFITLSFIALSVADALAEANFDFSAVCGSGQTLYYQIVAPNAVEITYPNVTDNWEYMYDGYTRPTGDLTIPDTVINNGVKYAVKSIGQDAFNSCSGITTVSIPNSVTSICQHAFIGCNNITSVVVPNSVTDIGFGAFYACDLTTISLPFVGDKRHEPTDKYQYPFGYIFGAGNYSGGTQTGQSYYGNSNTTPTSATYCIPTYLKEVIITGSSYIPHFAFNNCKGVTSITIPDTVTKIGDLAFSECVGLTSIAIPNSVSSIGVCAFAGCSNLKSVNIPEGITTIERGTFERCDNLSLIIIPNSVTSLEQWAFYDCQSLKNVFIPKTVTSISIKAFNNATIYCEVVRCPDGWVHNSSESNWYENSTVHWGIKKVKITEEGAFIPTSEAEPYTVKLASGCNKRTVAIPDSVVIDGKVYAVTSIGECAFSGCSNLISIKIPNSVKSIGNQAFLNCTKLYSITINNQTPPTLSSDNNLNDIQIYIPCGSLNNYKSVQYWDAYDSYVEEFLYKYSAKSDDEAKGTIEITKEPTCSENAIIQATAETGYVFYQWSDGNTANPRYLTVTQDTALVAYFVVDEVEVEIASANTAQGTVSNSSGTYHYNDEIEISATANYGYHFTCWSDSVTANPRTVTITKDTVIKAEFAVNQYAITLKTNVAERGTVSGGGSFNYLTNNQITATANYGYVFEKWSDGVTTNPRTVALTRDTAFTAVFVPDEVSVAVVSADTARGKVSALSGTHHYYDTITVSATANYGYHFARWSDSVTANPRTIVLRGDTVIQAQFAANQYSITIGCNNAELGTVSGGGTFDYLATTSISATANHGYAFKQWNDGNYDNPRRVTITQDTAFTAIFVPIEVNVEVKSADTERGTVTELSGVYHFNEKIIISAIAVPHHHFVAWSDGNRQNPRELLIRGDTVLTAAFGIDTFSVAAKCDTAMGAVSGAGLYSYGLAAKVEAKPAAHHHFVRWANGAVRTTQEFVVEHDTAFEVVFAIDRHSVALAASDSLCGAVSGAGSYDYGASVQLQATPAANCYFTGWSDGVTTNPRTLTVEGDTTIVAEFGKLQTINIIVAANDTLRGTVAGTGSYVVGSNATLSATASAHYLFEQWSDGRTDNPRTVRVIADATYTAVFVPMQYNIILSQNNADMGMVSGSGVYSYGDVVSCLAKPYQNYHFIQWSNGETANPYEFVIEGNQLLTAYFAAGAVTGIEDDAAVAPVIYAVGKTIIVENATNEILVYDAMGKLLCRDVACRVRTEITVNGTGVYIVKTGNAVMRVVVE